MSEQDPLAALSAAAKARSAAPSALAPKPSGKPAMKSAPNAATATAIRKPASQAKRPASGPLRPKKKTSPLPYIAVGAFTFLLVGGIALGIVVLTHKTPVEPAPESIASPTAQPQNNTTRQPVPGELFADVKPEDPNKPTPKSPNSKK